MAIDTEYDIIIAGGGSSGCLIAGRLAVADPALRILILEAGEHTRELPAHVQPARYFGNLVPSAKVMKCHVGKPSEHLGGRSPVVSAAHCLGGGSSVNFMMYTRAAASDYDDWETVFGNAGWGSKDLIPLLKKTETYQVKRGEENHGYSGPLKVSYGGAYSNVGKQFLDIAAKYDSRRGLTNDVNNMFSCNAYGRWEKWIDGETGRRSDVPHHFIYNQEHNQNLQVLTGCRVKRVVFENYRAVGVEYVNDTTFRPDADQEVRFVRAARLVVLSSGAFGSPTILERSGVGQNSVLENNGVQQILDLPGVGENYQDNAAFVPYLADDEAETLDALFRGDQDENEKRVAQWLKDGSGLLGHNALDAGIKMRPSADDLKEMGPDFESRWNKYFANAPDKPVIWLGPISVYIGDCSVVPARKYITMTYFTEYPVSLGSVHIKSGEDPNIVPDFDAGYLSHPADLAPLKWGYKMSRELVRRIGVYRGEFTPGHPNFPEGSEALCNDAAMGPVDVSTPNIAYTSEDDKAIDDYHRQNVQTTWHSMGTCSMKPRESGGVVDSRLNVYGVQGLKVAANVGANTYSTALVIGEKAALIIAEELAIDIKGV